MSRGGPRVALWWVLSRLVVLFLLFGPEWRAVGDVGYFARSLSHLGSAGMGHTLPEYPVLAVLLVAVPYVVAHALGAAWAYGFLFVLVMLAVDAAFTRALLRSTGAAGRAGLLAWLLLVPLMGGLSYVRFDLVPGVLVGAAVLAAARRREPATGVAALATSLKLWPVLLLPVTVAAAARRRAALAQVAVVGGVAAAATVVLGGWDRLWSPLAYQADRGLQIESLPATPAMVHFAVQPAASRIAYSASKSYEITGWGTSALLAVATWATLALAVLVVVLWWRTWRLGPDLPADAVVWTTACLVLGFLCTSKVLSPQYLLWLVPTACAGLATVRRTRRELLAWTAVLGVATVLSHLLFPTLYTPLAVHGGGTGLAVGVLVVRNALVVLLGAWALRTAWVTTRWPAPGVPVGERPVRDAVVAARSD